MTAHAFPQASASHPEWWMALELCLAQLILTPSEPDKKQVGIIYIHEDFNPYADKILKQLRLRTHIQDWVGSSGPYIFGNQGLFNLTPGISLMVAEFPKEHVRIFSADHPFNPIHSDTDKENFFNGALWVHSNQEATELSGVLHDTILKLGNNNAWGVKLAPPHTHIANKAGLNGLSGLALGNQIDYRISLLQGYQHLGNHHYQITAYSKNIILQLNHEPALDVLLQALGVNPESIQFLHTMSDEDKYQRVQTAIRLLKDVYVASSWQSHESSQQKYEMKQLRFVDAIRRELGLSHEVSLTETVSFYKKNKELARNELTHTITSMRDHVESTELKELRGAIYISNMDRAKQLFGSPNNELNYVRKSLGNTPVIGMFSDQLIYQQAIYKEAALLLAFY